MVRVIWARLSGWTDVDELLYLILNLSVASMALSRFAWPNCGSFALTARLDVRGAWFGQGARSGFGLLYHGSNAQLG